jgi:hypothetical protein
MDIMQVREMHHSMTAAFVNAPCSWHAIIWIRVRTAEHIFKKHHCSHMGNSHIELNMESASATRFGDFNPLSKEPRRLTSDALVHGSVATASGDKASWTKSFQAPHLYSMPFHDYLSLVSLKNSVQNLSL